MDSPGVDVFTSQRPPSPGLLAAVASLEAACFPERGADCEVARSLLLRRAALLVLPDGDGLLGFAHVTWTISGTLTRLCVRQDARECGRGRLLLAAALSTLRGAGVHTVTLHVDAAGGGAAARGLYAGAGFGVDGAVCANYYGPGSDAVCMVLAL